MSRPRYDIQYVIERVFIDKPLPPCSYKIELSENLSTKTTIFQTLMTIMIEGSKKIFGNSTTPSNISEEQYILLNEYMKSIGYEIKYKYLLSENEIPFALNVWFEPFINIP